MATSIHINTLKAMLCAPDPVDLVVWTKKGELQVWKNAVPLKYNREKGTQNFKLRDSGEIRQCHVILIHSINGLRIFL